ncbi:protein ABHD15 [Sceloporus undulatus]|uniref:protein ABHD15 n=1 Tax=Sceloporus undulatus TaxID=8520 RepID=UPI001C4D7C8C|nr:protein ABHD15 [Sceloporus undulatus]
MALWVMGILAFFLGLLVWRFLWLWRASLEEETGVRFGEETGHLVGDCHLFCKPSTLAQALLKSLAQSAELDARRWPWKNWLNLQTVARFLWPPDHPLEFARDHLQLTDRGIVALDWVVGPLSPGTKVFETLDPLVLLVVPNATGRITKNLHILCRLALQEGFYPVIFNRRGHNGCPLTSLKLQTFADPADLKEALGYIHFRYPSATLFAVSEGSGSGLLLSYLGECGSSSSLRGAVCISPLLKAKEWFKRGCPWWYEWALLLFQKQEISRYAKVLEEVVKMDRVLESCSLRAFEEALFCNQKTQSMDWEAYWDRNDPLRDVDEVAVPVLCLCSVDDPIRGPPAETLPWELFQSNPYFFLLLSPHGGHCGFFGEGPDSSWGNTVALEYLCTLVEFFRTEETTSKKLRQKNAVMEQRYHRSTVHSREALPPSGHFLQETFSWQRSYTR